MTVALGREEKLYAVPEVTFGTAVQPVAGDAVRFKSLQFGMNQVQVNRDDRRATRSYLAKVVRRKDATWSASGYLLPSGAAGTAPDGWDALLKAGFGTEALSGGVSAAYTLLKENTKSLSLHRAIGYAAATDIAAETMRGCVVNQLQFKLSGQDEALITASGMGKDVLRAGVTTIVSDSGTAVAVASGKGPLFDAGMYVDVGATSAVLINSVATDTLTCASHGAGSNGNAISPTICNTSQTFTSTAVPVAGILGSVTLDSASFTVVTAEITLQNGVQMHNDTFGYDSAQSFHLNERTVNGNIAFRLTDANALNIFKTKSFGNSSLTLVCGTTAGSIATFSLPIVRFDYAAIQIGGAQDIIVTMPFQALGSSGEDELSLTFT